VFPPQGEAGGGGVAAVLEDHAGQAAVHQIQGVAQVQAGDGAAGAAQQAVAGVGEDEGGAVVAFLQARGQQAHHALVPARVEQDDAGAVGDLDAVQQGQGLVLHFRFDAAPFPVELVQFAGQGQGMIAVGCQQTFDAQAHVGEAAGGVEAGADGEAQVLAAGPGEGAAGHLEQGLDAGPGLALADAGQALGHQQAVVGVQPHHVGHGAQGHQVQQVGQVGFRLSREGAAFAQLRAQGHQHVEHDAHAGQVLAGKESSRAGWG
jgi:hypothetical protein